MSRRRRPHPRRFRPAAGRFKRPEPVKAMPRNTRLSRRAFLRLMGAASSFMTIPGLSSAVRAATPLDEYGGIKVAVGPPSKVFGRAKVNGRWVLVTPEGNAFWMLGIF